MHCSINNVSAIEFELALRFQVATIHSSHPCIWVHSIDPCVVDPQHNAKRAEQQGPPAAREKATRRPTIAKRLVMVHVSLVGWSRLSRRVAEISTAFSC